jgi:hypothetical protein
MFVPRAFLGELDASQALLNAAQDPDPAAPRSQQAMTSA